MKNARPRALLALLAVAAAAPAMAASTEGEANIFAGDLGNVLWTLLIFGLVLLILGKYAWGPLLDVLQKREDFILSSLEEAKRDRIEAEARLREYEQRLREARAEATAIVEEGRRDAEVLRGRIEHEAREEAEKIRARTLRDIGIARETALKELYEVGGKLATSIAAQIVERELRAEDHQKLIDNAIAEMERLGAN
jgi:F-type H+-transporting ATPase subunit b